VTCSDCHDPHSLELRAPGNALCGRCHTPAAFDTPAHHHHDRSSVGSACVECHMPARTYMQIDLRRDHSLRVPRPDLSASLGVPNACAVCHPNTGADQLAGIVSSWGIVAKPSLHFGEVLARARAGDSGVADALVDLVLANDSALMVRASAAALLGAVTPSGGPSEGLRAIRVALGHAHPLVRLGALQSLDGAEASIRWALAAESLSDPIRAVRLRAAQLLAAVAPEINGAPDPRLDPRLDRAVSELLASLERDGDRAEAHVQRGNLLVDLGRYDEASDAYSAAVTRDPELAATYVNWCDLLRRRGDEAGCAAKLDEGLARAPDSPELHHALALSQIRRGQKQSAISELAAAAQLAPEVSTYAWALVIALRERGELTEAAAVLSAAQARHPHDQALRALASEP
jgi:tetratricopeptide (TPR) repeat protein